MRSIRNTAAVLALAASASVAGAQGATYTTTGQFTFNGTQPTGVSCNNMMAATTAVCQGNGFTLTFNGTPGLNIANGSIASLGQFTLAGTGSQTVNPGIIGFTLNIMQTLPNAGMGSLVGSISGTVSTTNGNFSSAIWTPNQVVTISPVTYTLIYDNIGPAANKGLNIPINNTRGINALVTVAAVPEPSTYALLATGLLGLAGAVRRRRNAAV